MKSQISNRDSRSFEEARPVPESEVGLPAELSDRLSELIGAARRTVYELDRPTRLDSLATEDGQLVYAKREDTSRIHSYKWRGAYFKMATLMRAGVRGTLVAASAGNHAQGVAAAARQLGAPTTIFMPRTTPVLKQKSVRQLGGRFVTVELSGDCFDDAYHQSVKFCQQQRGTLIEPFDDMHVIAGQATIGLELLQQRPTLSQLYLPIGGGGLASGVAFAARVLLEHSCRIIGVEVAGQNSMQRSIRRGQRERLSEVDVFCDGTAVREPGKLTFAICRQLLDDVVVVDNVQVSKAIRAAWEAARFIPEPAGAIALAGALQNANANQNEEVAVVVTGANTDFKTLPRIVHLCDCDRHASRPETTRRYFQFEIAEQNGTLIALLDRFMADMNIVDFQYGRSHPTLAFPVLGIEGPAAQFEEFSRRLTVQRVNVRELSGRQFTEYRMIPYRPDLCEQAAFFCIDFPDRPGSLRELLRKISRFTSICYFNYHESGETVGHALIGFELKRADAVSALYRCLRELHFQHQPVTVAGRAW